MKTFKDSVLSSLTAMPDRHIMIDIETLDVSVTAAIIAIGAVVFNPRSSGFDDELTFHITCDEASNVRAGRTVSESTKQWWAGQSPEAQESVFAGPHTPLPIALNRLVRWINQITPTCTRVWAKSPDFDCAILAHACAQQGYIWPFRFWEARCCRTAIEMAYPEGDFPPMAVPGPKHDALVDAKVQVLEIQHAYFVLGC